MTNQRAQRRLAAILAADVVGYSRLMAADESGTLAALKAHRSDLIDPAISEHGGRLVKLMGDGALVEFSSVVDAVECAVAIQRGMAGRNADLPENRRIVFRIGINLGDIIIDGDDIYGDGVNVAARLEGLAEPGGICISSSVREQVRDKVPISFADLGEQSVKNIDRPVRVYYAVLDLSQTGAAPAGHAVDAPLLPDRPSIAVLPFVNMSDDPEQEYFADGIAEDIITGLSRLRWLFVIARNSSFTYKGRNVDVRQVGRELGVRYVLEGSVRKGGNRIRITGQLIEAETGNHLWAERYDRALDDVFAIQDEIAESVLGCLQPELFAAEHERLKRKPPQNLDAWDRYIKGMFLYSQHTDAGTREALDMLAEAVALDSGYAQALGLSAVCRMWRLFQGWEDPAATIPRAIDEADRAVTANPNEPWAYLAKGFIALALRRDSDAHAAFSRAIQESPNFAYAHGLLGANHALAGRPDEAIAPIDRGLRLSPRDIFGDEYQLYYGFAHFQAGRYADAASAAQLAIQQRPGHPTPYILAVGALGLAGERDRAAGLVQRLTVLVPDATASRMAENFPYYQAADRERLAEGLRAAGTPD